MKSFIPILLVSFLIPVSQLSAESPPAVEGHKAFMEGLREIKKDAIFDDKLLKF